MKLPIRKEDDSDAIDATKCIFDIWNPPVRFNMVSVNKLWKERTLKEKLQFWKTFQTQKASRILPGEKGYEEAHYAMHLLYQHGTLNLLPKTDQKESHHSKNED